MSHPSSAEARCPECGASLEEGASACWLCRRTREAENLHQSSSPAGPDKKSVGQFSLASVFLVITLIAVCLGALKLAPGLGLAVILVATPALIRACVVNVQKKRTGRSLTIGEKLVAFFASTAIVILVGLAGFIAFEIACWGSCAMIAGIEQNPSDHAFWIGVSTGVLAALAIMIWLFWKTRPRGRSKTGR
jgi:hypothetical protein